MNSLLLDFQAAVRFFCRRRAAFAVIVLTMALAIGANTAVFSVFKAFLFSNLAVPESDRVYAVWTARDLPGRGSVNFSDAYPNYKLLTQTTHSFAALSVTLPADLNWEQQDNARRLQGLRATASFFTVMKMQPILGRVFTAGEEGPRPAQVVVIGYALWKGNFAGSPDVIGRTLQLNGAPHTIIGVMPSGFEKPTGAEVWLPFDLPDDQWSGIVGARQLTTYARLADGVTAKMANAELKEFTKRAIEMDIANKDWTWVVQSLRSVLLSGADGTIIFVQSGAAVLLVLAVCNLASLLMAWAAERQRETAVRLALGASGWRLIRQFLVQSVTLAAVGGGLGVLLAAVSLPLLAQLNPNPGLSGFLTNLELDGATLGFAALLVLGTGIVAGLLPAWQSQAVSFLEALRSESRGASLSRGALRWQQAMVVVQSAVSVLILVGAGLATLGFYQLNRVQLGFVADRRVALHFQFPEPAMATHEQRTQMVRELELNLAREPALEAFGVTSTLPVGDIQWGGGFWPQLSSGEYTRDVSVFHYRRVTPTYLAAMGVPLLSGRMLDDRDRADGPPVAVISKALADRFWPGADPIGRKLKRVNPNLAPYVEIVGVVGNVLDAGAGLPAGETVYVPWEQQSLRRSWMLLQARGSIEDAIAAGRRALRATAPSIATFDVETLEKLSRQANALPRLQMSLLALFAVIAIGITALGSYGVMSQLVANRQKELAIRAALGATQGGVLRLVLWQNARLAASGTALGLIAAWFAARATQAQLAGFDASMIWPYVVVGASVLLLTQLASFLPAHRAAKLEVQSVLAEA